MTQRLDPDQPGRPLHSSRRALLRAAALGGLATLLPRDAHAGPASQVNDSQDTLPLPPLPEYKGPRPELKSSPVYKLALPAWGVYNNVACDAIVKAVAADPRADFQLAVVPGTSELLGHHTAWAKRLDGHWVEPEFRARLRGAFVLLASGAVKGIVISGGSVDAGSPGSPGYNEALCGYKDLMTTYAARFRSTAASKGAALEMRVMVEPWAIHSEDNVRNGDRLSLLLGLDRNLVVTTAGKHKQGWWFTHHKATANLGAIAIRWGAFDPHCKKDLGYPLGAFGGIGGGGGGAFGTGEQAFPDLPRVHDYPSGYQRHAEKFLKKGGSPPSTTGGAVLDTAFVAHWALNAQSVLADPKWDVGMPQKPAMPMSPMAFEHAPQ